MRIWRYLKPLCSPRICTETAYLNLHSFLRREFWYHDVCYCCTQWCHVTWPFDAVIECSHWRQALSGLTNRYFQVHLLIATSAVLFLKSKSRDNSTKAERTPGMQSLTLPRSRDVSTLREDDKRQASLARNISLDKRFSVYRSTEEKMQLPCEQDQDQGNPCREKFLQTSPKFPVWISQRWGDAAKVRIKIKIHGKTLGVNFSMHQGKGEPGGLKVFVAEAYDLLQTWRIPLQNRHTRNNFQYHVALRAPWDAEIL